MTLDQLGGNCKGQDDIACSRAIDEETEVLRPDLWYEDKMNTN